MSAVSVSGHGQLAQVADRPVDAVLEHQPPLGQEHPDRLDRVERDAVGPGDDRVAGVGGQAGHQPGQELAHRLDRERLEVDRGEAALAGAPVGPALEQLGPGQGQDEDRDAPGPLEQVVDEVEQARVGVVEVLEDHHDRAARGEPLEERAPGPEELLRARRPTRAQQRQQRRLDPGPLGLVGDVLLEHRGDRRPGRRLVVGLLEAGPAADHLAERPEA